MEQHRVLCAVTAAQYIPGCSELYKTGQNIFESHLTYVTPYQSLLYTQRGWNVGETMRLY